jgi:hypothetical protein
MLDQVELDSALMLDELASDARSHTACLNQFVGSRTVDFSEHNSLEVLFLDFPIPIPFHNSLHGFHARPPAYLQ